MRRNQQTDVRNACRSPFVTHSARFTNRIRRMEAMLFCAVLALLVTWAAFWVIRLAVRYGMNDALRMNRAWLVPERDRDATAR